MNPNNPLRVPAENVYNPVDILHATITGPPNDPNYLTAIAPLMRPPTITRMLQQAGRRVQLVAPVFIDTYAPEVCRTNPHYIATVAALVVPATIGARGERSTSITIQACAVGYNAGDCCNPLESKLAVQAGLKAAWVNLPESIRGELLIEDAPPQWVAGVEPIPDGTIQWMLERISQLDIQPPMTVSIFATALIAFCKQGTATTNVLNKVTNAARDELGLNIQLDPNVIRSFWNSVGLWYTPEKAAPIFALWETAIGGSCLRFRLLVQQASWTGMTNYINICNAKNQYPDFDWAKCCKMFPQDFNNYQAAVAAVAGNPYYGYNRDLGPAKSTLYPNLSYVAYALLLNIGGERSLRDFLGTNRNTPFAAPIDVMIREYEATRNARLQQPAGPIDQHQADVFTALRPFDRPPQQ